MSERIDMVKYAEDLLMPLRFDKRTHCKWGSTCKDICVNCTKFDRIEVEEREVEDREEE